MAAFSRSNGGPEQNHLTALPRHVLSAGGYRAALLLVHAVIVIVPLAALCTALSGLWPAARRRLGVLTPVLALLALVLTAFIVQAALIAVAVLGVCVGAIIDRTMIGEAGSRAVWEGNFSPAPVNRR